ncbi:MAG: hypothetical protein KBD76_07875 [Bacteriovorax sp.]|nr:hypothetical protein [Bacteriovorax sp.]
MKCAILMLSLVSYGAFAGSAKDEADKAEWNKGMLEHVAKVKAKCGTDVKHKLADAFLTSSFRKEGLNPAGWCGAALTSLSDVCEDAVYKKSAAKIKSFNCTPSKTEDEFKLEMKGAELMLTVGPKASNTETKAATWLKENL